MKVYEINKGASRVVKLSPNFKKGATHLLIEKTTELKYLSEIIFDLSGLSYLEDELALFLVNIRAANPLLGGKIKLLNPNPLVLKMLEFRNLDQMYDIQNIFPTAW